MEKEKGVKVVCCVCGILIKDGPADRVSHAYCDKCYEVLMAEFAHTAMDINLVSVVDGVREVTK